jgi:hypothetical protein
MKVVRADPTRGSVVPDAGSGQARVIPPRA